MFSFAFSLPPLWLARIFRKKTLPEKIKSVLKKVRTGYVPDGLYGIGTCPRFWRTVFMQVYHEAPAGNADPRWDELFKIGIPLMRMLERKP